MRLLNRLNQYQRLWQPSAGKPQTVTISELAERCFCSERMFVRCCVRHRRRDGWSGRRSQDAESADNYAFWSRRNRYAMR
ncbi:TPA: hypothetical protein JLL67_000955 [Escherichia coli]|nr:hypothetical protein [Escherichia coli]HAW7480963.1 hypothetical protein [Escherichia coli]HAW7825865.1 hypothetical protein [Escherichia coli]